MAEQERTVVVNAETIYDIVEDLKEGRPHPLMTMTGAPVYLVAGNPETNTIDVSSSDLRQIRIEAPPRADAQDA